MPKRYHFCLLKARGVCGGTTEKGLVSDGSPRGDFFRRYCSDVASTDKVKLSIKTNGFIPLVFSIDVTHNVTI